ncbi:hypothetical protein AB0M83_11975 [Amycolatopsis sp. NPDC051106]
MYLRWAGKTELVIAAAQMGVHCP